MCLYNVPRFACGDSKLFYDGVPYYELVEECEKKCPPSQVNTTFIELPGMICYDCLSTNNFEESWDTTSMMGADEREVISSSMAELIDQSADAPKESCQYTKSSLSTAYDPEESWDEARVRYVSFYEDYLKNNTLKGSKQPEDQALAGPSNTYSLIESTDGTSACNETTPALPSTIQNKTELDGSSVTPDLIRNKGGTIEERLNRYNDLRNKAIQEGKPLLASWYTAQIDANKSKDRDVIRYCCNVLSYYRHRVSQGMDPKLPDPTEKIALMKKRRLEAMGFRVKAARDKGDLATASLLNTIHNAMKDDDLQKTATARQELAFFEKIRKQ